MSKRVGMCAAAALALASSGCSVDIDSGGAVPSGYVGVHPYATLPASTEAATAVEWGSVPTSYRGRNGLRVRFDCPANGSDGSVWGTDVYTDDSSVCYSAVHFGRIGLATGGPVIIEIRAGRTSYQASTRNGITSIGYGEWPGSFIVL